MFSVLSLLILYVPRIIFEFSTVVCSKMYPAEKEKCNYSEAKPFFTELTSLHGIVQPLIFLWFCDHFWSATPLGTIVAVRFKQSKFHIIFNDLTSFVYNVANFHVSIIHSVSSLIFPFHAIDV